MSNEHEREGDPPQDEPSFETEVLEALENINSALWAILRRIEELPKEQR